MVFISTLLVLLTTYLTRKVEAQDTPFGTLGVNMPNTGGSFYMGAVVNYTSAEANDMWYRSILNTEFSYIAWKDAFSWANTEPSEGQFNFTLGDQLVQYATTNGNALGVMGLTLVPTSPSRRPLLSTLS
jgi:GH35 family endo-1,4-beta-xylanase